MKLLTKFIILSFFGYICCYRIHPGPQIIATKGEVWPKPQVQEKGEGFLVVNPQDFKFQAIRESCETLQKAFARYLDIICSTNLGRRNKIRTASSNNPKAFENENSEGYLKVLEVELTEKCSNNEIPTPDMEENYSLHINEPEPGKAILKSRSIWGILRGLETFSQLLYRADDGINLRINSTTIEDFPRFQHRGLLLDTSRHFIPMSIILQILDGMAYNKLNVFHWHIVDDQSFPYISKAFPELSEQGAYDSTLVYTPENVQQVISYAAERGIRVMAEFDTPGHTRSWGEGQPELLTKCYFLGFPNGYLGPIDPTKETTYIFLKKLFEEIVQVFPEQYVHLGGDEVDFECWRSNPSIKSWMKNQQMSGDFVRLEEYYIQKVVDIVSDLNASSVVWEKVYVNGVSLPKDTVVHVWKDGRALSDATKDGLRTIWSSCWYLSQLLTGGDWEKYYKCDPHTSFRLTPEQEKLVIGGEACMWAENVDASNVLPRIFPRVSAAAEKLWSARDVTNIKEAAKRLEEHACRMNARGIPAQPPNGPGFCL